MKKVWFLKALEISLLLFISLFFVVTSIQAQNNYAYDFSDYYTSFYPWDAWAMNYQDYNRYVQSNWSKQNNFQSFYPSYPPIPSWNSSEDNFYRASTPVYTATFRSPGLYDPFPLNSGLDDLALISWNPSTQMYSLPFRPGNIGTNGVYMNSAGWDIFFPAIGGLSPMLISNGQLTTWEGTSKITTITEEDYGETIIVNIGEQFRVLLRVYDNISTEDFLNDYNGPGWEQEDRHLIDEIKPMTMKIDGYEQENLYTAIKRGERELIFNYYAPGNTNTIEDTFRVNIMVE